MQSRAWTGWGTWIRTRTNGVRVRGSTVNLFPSDAASYATPAGSARRLAWGTGGGGSGPGEGDFVERDAAEALLDAGGFGAAHGGVEATGEGVVGEGPDREALEA